IFLKNATFLKGQTVTTMILPNKHLSGEQTLIWISGEILSLLKEPKTVSRLWEELRQLRYAKFGTHSITYNWFVLALDLLFLLGAIKLFRGRIRKTTHDPQDI
ncbi:MAG: ABC-three component system middle component 6, partial [Chloroflexota bacterium]